MHFCIGFKLCSSGSDDNGGLFEVGGGWISQVRYQRSQGVVLLIKSRLFDPDMVAEAWDTITDFSKSDYPASALDSLKRVIEI